MRLFYFLLLLLLLLAVFFLVWVFWPAEPATFSRRNVPFSPIDSVVNQRMDSLLVLPLSEEEPELVATLMEFRPDSVSGKGVLYIHGFGDYFFHPHLADWFTDRGYHFFALDLRRYGRSLRPAHRPCYTTDLEDYFVEIARSLQVMRTRGCEQFLLFGHSTGGLTASLFAASPAGREQLDALLLNSPFFRFNATGVARAALSVGRLVGALNPEKQLRGTGNPAYSYAIHRDFFGEWDYNTDWKPLEGFPVYAGWVKAILEGHRAVKAGLDLQLPVLVLHSDSTYRYAAGPDYAPAMQRMDAILDVEDIRTRSARLGSQVEIRPVDDAMHDIFLSAPPVRREAFRIVEEWLERKF